MEKKFLLTIAGPQSAGKTTVFQMIKNHFPYFNFLSEINPYTFYGEKHLGGAFNDEKTEILIIEKDLEQLKKIKENTVVETGIFHLVYSEIFSPKKTKKFFQEYLNLYYHFQNWLIFIDVKPEISWKRRRKKYQERVKNLSKEKQKEALNRYKNNLYRLYPLWLKYLKIFPFNKIIIKNSYKNFFNFKKEILGKVNLILKNSRGYFL